MGTGYDNQVCMVGTDEIMEAVYGGRVCMLQRDGGMEKAVTEAVKSASSQIWHVYLFPWSLLVPFHSPLSLSTEKPVSSWLVYHSPQSSLVALHLPLTFMLRKPTSSFKRARQKRANLD